MLVVLAGAALPGAAGAAASGPTAKASASAPVTVGANPLGVDVGPWDALSPGSGTTNAVLSYLKAAGIRQLHYGGGVTADEYDWQLDTDLSTCYPATAPSEFSAQCATEEPLDFSDFSQDARAGGAQSYVTVNYGTGSAAMAAQWVTESASVGEGVSQWSIGNESYGCWEYNNWLAQPPEDYARYVPGKSGCPMTVERTSAKGMEVMADSYAYNAGQYMSAMTAAGNAVGVSVKLGVPWAFDDSVSGAAVAENDIWNNTVLGSPQTNPYISFVEAHWYPFGFGGDVGEDGNPTAQRVIQSVQTIPGEYANIRDGLDANGLPNATVTVGETGVSYLATNIPCIPAGGLFAAGDALEWLASGAQTVDWWPIETGANAGSACTSLEEAMFTGNGTPDPVYTGYLLASELAQPNAELSTLTVPDLSDPSDTADTFGFQSVLPDGQVAVALVNANPSAAQNVSIGSSLSGTLATQTYSNGNQNASNSKIVDGTTTAGAIADGITLPAESITVLKSVLPSSVTLGAAALVKAGTKITVSGQLALNGAAAPAGTVVKVYRRVAGRPVNAAALSATTGPNGSFTVTDVPPAYGHYDYVASYSGSGLYAAATSSVAVRVIAIQPTLKLRFSAGSVKPRRKVTVTATLAGWHNNRTLVIYARPKGGARKVIARASANARGQLVISFTVRANTTFTVTYGGDRWYGSGSASGVVKA